MQHLEAAITALEEGTAPPSEVEDAATRQRPLLIGADGVMSPFRPQAGTPQGKTRWREVNVGILARLGQRCTRRGEPVTRLDQRRVVAVLGDTTGLHARLWLEARRQAITSSPTVVWISDGAWGLWNIFAARFAPYAIGVLDCSHVMQNIWQVLLTCADKTAAGQAKARRLGPWMWFALRRGEQDEVLDEIQRGSVFVNPKVALSHFLWRTYARRYGIPGCMGRVLHSHAGAPVCFVGRASWVISAGQSCGGGRGWWSSLRRFRSAVRCRLHGRW
jgi:hypothetical protein